MIVGVIITIQTHLKEDLSYSWTPEHMHIETRDKGGMIGRGLFRNKSGKPEMVLDADSTKSLEDNFPGFLDALNKADYDGALAVLRNYASYETGGVQFIPVPIPMKDSKSQSPAGRRQFFKNVHNECR